MVPSLRSNIRAAVRSLWEAKQRSLLSAMGVMVGSVAIVLLISIAKGVQADIGRQVESLGVNLLVIIPGRVPDGAMFAPNLAGVSYLKDEDLDRIRAVPGVTTAAPLMFVGGGIRSGKQESPITFILAASSEWFKVRPVSLKSGRTLTPADNSSRVCVIGSIAEESLFKKASGLGKTVRINDIDYKVVGVTQDKQSEGSMFSFGGFENIAYVPYELLKKTVPNPQLNRIMIRVDSRYEPKELVAAVDKAMAQRLSRELFSVFTQEDLLKLAYKITGILATLLTGLTSIALFVGGVGIMTVMLMSVNERSREIGIRKAMGARNSDIFIQFLAESVLISILGGTLGLALSVGVCAYLVAFTVVKPLVTMGIVGLCFGVSLGVGCFFGLIPALRAARKDPVVSLRNEG